MNKAPSQIDKIVGQRMRTRRMLIGMSQEKLGERLGITFQQVQKYEKGTNRISVGRLAEIAHTLGVTVQSFFAEPDRAAKEAEGLVVDKDSLELLRAFSAVRNPAMRKAILALARAAAEEPEAAAAGSSRKRALRAV